MSAGEVMLAMVALFLLFLLFVGVMAALGISPPKRLTAKEAAALAADISALMKESAAAMNDMAETHETLLASHQELRAELGKLQGQLLAAQNREVILQAEVERLRGLLNRLLDADHDLAVQTEAEEVAAGQFMCTPVYEWNRHADIVREVRSASA